MERLTSGYVPAVITRVIGTRWSAHSGRNEGGPRGHISPGAESLLGALRSPNNVTSTFFITVRLPPNDVRFERGVPDLLLAPGAI